MHDRTANRPAAYTQTVRHARGRATIHHRPGAYIVTRHHDHEAGHAIRTARTLSAAVRLAANLAAGAA